MTAQNALIADDMCLVSRKADGLHGAVTDAFIAVFAVGFFQCQAIGHGKLSSLPFVLDHVKYILLEKFSEILSRHAYVNIIVDLHGNADSVAFTYAEASREDYFFFDMVLSDRILEQPNDLRRALKMTGRTNTDLNNQHLFIPSP